MLLLLEGDYRLLTLRLVCLVNTEQQICSNRNARFGALRGG